MKISVFGTGYVGLVTGSCFADLGNHVIGVDIDFCIIRLVHDSAGRLAVCNGNDIRIIDFCTNRDFRHTGCC